MRREMLRWGVAFGLLFCGVFFAFWWSSAALRFGAGRVADTAAPTWQVWGEVTNAVSGEPVPWAAVEDDPSGRPPYYRADADYRGWYSLLTLAEPHQVLVHAQGYKSITFQVGRQWFAWWPKGKENRNLRLLPEP